MFRLNKLRFTIRHFTMERARECLRPGASIVLDGQPYRVTKIIQGKRGKGGGFVRATLKGLISNTSFEKTFTSDELVEETQLSKKECQYSWTDGRNYIFMDSETFEEITLSEEDTAVGDMLYEGMIVKMQIFEGKVIGVELPKVTEYKVIGFDTSGGVPNQQLAILNCPKKLHVPLFINQGDSIRVSTVNWEYSDRA